jgi:hypothetical protein
VALILYEDWDEVTAPAITSDWTTSGSVKTASSGPTPISSPNMLEVLYGGVSPTGRQPITYNYMDGAGGNIQLTGTGLFTGGLTGNGFSILARCSACPFNYSADSGYEFQLAGSGTFYVNRIVSGASTTLFSLSITGLGESTWVAVHRCSYCIFAANEVA